MATKLGKNKPFIDQIVRIDEFKGHAWVNCQAGSSCSGMTYGNQIWYREPLTEMQCTEGPKGRPWGQIAQKCHMATKLGRNNPWPESKILLRSKFYVVVSRVQPEVILLKNAVLQPRSVGRTPDQSVLHCWVIKGHVWGQLGSAEVKLLRNALQPPNQAIGLLLFKSIMMLTGALVITKIIQVFPAILTLLSFKFINPTIQFRPVEN